LQLSRISRPSKTCWSRCKETHLSLEVIFVCCFHARFGFNQKNSFCEHHSNCWPHVVSFAAVHMTLSPTVDSACWYIRLFYSSTNLYFAINLHKQIFYSEYRRHIPVSAHCTGLKHSFPILSNNSLLVAMCPSIDYLSSIFHFNYKLYTYSLACHKKRDATSIVPCSIMLGFLNN
jgi:hypothetical protein